ncbi:ABC transporter permease [Salinicoccus luteus]|uniref:ABC transporter permease n=1 Tax=Salinicoccus luteus TaxID=367840 RepID=UPI0004E0B70A|nr:ABC transporter permease subunit [Salinicoccus luteus]
MNQMLPLFKKEFIESWRNFKFAAILIVFAIIGILSPFTALILPDILGMVMDDSGITVEIPESTTLDSYMQFFSNMNQMGLVIFVIVFGSILTHEFSRNTLVNLVTKGLKRTNVIVVKALFLMLVWTIGYALSALVAYMYTIYYWDEPVDHLVLAFAMTWVYGLFIISLILLASTLFTNSFIAVLFSVVAAVIVMLMAGIHPDAAAYLPQYLIGNNVGLLAGEIDPEDVLGSMAITAVLSLVFILLAIIRFKKVPMN